MDIGGLLGKLGPYANRFIFSQILFYKVNYSGFQFVVLHFNS